MQKQQQQKQKEEIKFLMPQFVPERELFRTFPQPYDVNASPYTTEMWNFSLVTRKELEGYKMPKSKVIFIGDVSVGKTTVINRYCHEKFTPRYKATIGVDFEIENFRVEGQNFTLEIWDTAGQERFRCIAHAYYRNAKVIVVVYDMSKPKTLKSAESWLKSALNATETEDPLIFLVGTKSDLVTKEEFITVEKDALNIAQKLKAEYWSVSASTGFMVNKLFQRIAALAFERTLKLCRMYQSTNASELQRKSLLFDFKRNFYCNELTTEKKRNYCFC